MTMSRHDHREREGEAHPPVQRRRDDEAQHPLLDLQQQAGNAAVARLVVQRHTLDPEEEHG